MVTSGVKVIIILELAQEIVIFICWEEIPEIKKLKIYQEILKTWV